MTGLGIYIKSAWLTVAGFGVIQGIGLGLGYLTPVKTLMMWFKNNKGFAAGLAIAGFGLAGVIGNPIIGRFLETTPIYRVFWTLTVIYGIALLLASILIYRPEMSEKEKSINDRPVKEIILKRKFTLLWVVFFINIMCGLALISQEKQIYNMIGVSSLSLVVLYCSINAIANLVGRLLMGTLQDKLNYKHIPYWLMVALSIAACLLGILYSNIIVTTIIMIFIVQFMFGCGFACMPNILHQNYGLKQLATVHGLILSAWAFAGLIGNQLSAYIMNNHNLQTLYIVLGIFYTIELIILLYWHFHTRVKRDIMMGIIKE